MMYNIIHKTYICMHIHIWATSYENLHFEMWEQKGTDQMCPNNAGQHIFLKFNILFQDSNTPIKPMLQIRDISNEEDAR